MGFTIESFILTDSNSNRSLDFINHDESNAKPDRPGPMLIVPSGTKVRWEAVDGDLTIDFVPPSPFLSGDVHITAKKGKYTKWETLITLPVAAGPNPSFKYTADLSGVAQDPEIIIDDSGGGPHPNKKSSSKAKSGKSAATKKKKKR